MTRCEIRPSQKIAESEARARKASNTLIMKVGAIVIVLLSGYLLGFNHAAGRASMVQYCEDVAQSVCWWEAEVI